MKEKHTRTPLRVGLTGGIGSGKSTVSKLFEALGVPVIDADLIARKLATEDQTIVQAITEHFGETLLNAQGEINRKQLRTLIFSDDAAKGWLEALLHPKIRKIMRQQASQITEPYCILVIPLLIETGCQQDDLVDRILVVDAPEESQIARIETRDHVDSAHVKAIMATQVTRNERLAQADDVISNTGNLTQLSRQVTHLHEQYSHTT